MLLISLLSFLAGTVLVLVSFYTTRNVLRSSVALLTISFVTFVCGIWGAAVDFLSLLDLIGE
ncbi:hypothetical protein LOK74_00700 [Brevibacillus humidisoli]|uniref:hypothetical protein n=1 Tax=Brevibacillus humidisoli TaxID=2895522 RepID=UPI001E4BEFA1|nr:hypothetical protein [Brevibacillus humidisoli]UFJ41115.1 hypothetical protein LOK74_00700 [Brevibacillus humidisoli]